MEESPKGKTNKKNKKNVRNTWPYKVFILALLISLCFSILSELVLGGAGIVVAIIVIIVFVALAIVTDMIGVAVTACSKEPFMAMCSKKVRGAKEGLALIKNADKVSSLCADVVGDVCGILSGAAGASIVAKIVIDTQNTMLAILIASLVASVIAGITIFGKAIGKRRAMDNCSAIILRVGKVLSIFTRQPKKKKQVEASKDEKRDLDKTNDEQSQK